jgi:hypothetical protein
MYGWLGRGSAMDIVIKHGTNSVEQILRYLIFEVCFADCQLGNGLNVIFFHATLFVRS